MIKLLKEKVLFIKFTEHFISEKRYLSKQFFFAIVISLVFSLLECSVEENKEISIIPKPQKMTIKSGEFVISNKTKIWFEPSGEEIVGVADYLSDMLNHAGGFEFTADAHPGGNIPTFIF